MYLHKTKALKALENKKTLAINIFKIVVIKVIYILWQFNTYNKLSYTLPCKECCKFNQRVVVGAVNAQIMGPLQILLQVVRDGGNVCSFTLFKERLGDSRISHAAKQMLNAVSAQEER